MPWGSTLPPSAKSSAKPVPIAACWRPTVKTWSSRITNVTSAPIAAKDSGIALKLAEGEGLKLPLAKSTWKQYEKMKELGLGELDKSGVAELTFKGRTLHS